MFDDLHALVEFAQAGSIAGAADRLYRTPSAITRQPQRLEAALGAELLDRSVKPPRLNSLGSRVLEQARDLTEKYPKVRLRLLSELTVELFKRLLAGELDVAVVLLPEGRTAPPPLVTNIIASSIGWSVPASTP
jgi:DNA-binding transcriptional LysR family regulator